MWLNLHQMEYMKGLVCSLKSKKVSQNIQEQETLENTNGKITCFFSTIPQDFFPTSVTEICKDHLTVLPHWLRGKEAPQVLVKGTVSICYS